VYKERLTIVFVIALVITSFSIINNYSHAAEDAGHAGMIHGSKSVLNMHVELMVEPDVIEPNRVVTFYVKFMDNVTGELLNDIPHTLVLVTSDDKEMFREYAERADHRHTFVFGEEHIGQLIVKIEGINKTDESIEFPLRVIPEFPYTILTIVMASTIALVLVVNKSRWLRI
jgi:acetyltransferase-like isoleucine patch superfamily enzyme